MIQSGDTFTSPGYPDELPANQSCAYTMTDVQVYGSDYVSTVVFTDFNIPAYANGTCTSDTYVEVRTENNGATLT